MSTGLWPLICIGILLVSGCNSQHSADDSEQADEVAVRTTTPVTICSGTMATIQDSVQLSAVSTYQLQTDIKASINGYINKSALHLGDAVRAGQTLFVLQTKESKSLGSTIDRLDSSFQFSGISRIKSTVSGYVTMLNHQAGDYVQDGETLASITDKNSFGFILNLPFAYRTLVHLRQALDIELPDGSNITGTVRQILPRMDTAAQTEQIFVKTTSSNKQLILPAGLIANTTLVTDTASGFSLPKDCLFTDDSQQNFWVMQLINDSTAVKVSVIKGLENDTRAIIRSPSFSLKDRFVLEGGYGLPDTAQIRIQ